VKTANLGGEWRHKIHLLHVGVGTEGQQCCTRAVKLFCSREHLTAQIPSNSTTQPKNFLPQHHFSIHLDQFSQHANGAVCSSETLKPISQNEYNLLLQMTVRQCAYQRNQLNIF
jgi:sugar diacid utilization regulator